MLPSDSPAKIRPNHSARASRPDTSESEARAAVRTASSVSAHEPSGFCSTIAASIVRISARSLAASTWTALRRSFGSSARTSIAASASAIAAFTSPSVSFSSAPASVSRSASSSPPCSERAAARRTPRSGANSLSAASAASICPRRLLLIVTSSGSGDGISAGLPVIASTTPDSDLIHPAPCPSTRSVPSCSALSTGRVIGSGLPAIDSIAAAFSSKSSEASCFSASASTACADSANAPSSSAAQAARPARIQGNRFIGCARGPRLRWRSRAKKTGATACAAPGIAAALPQETVRTRRAARPAARRACAIRRLACSRCPG